MEEPAKIVGSGSEASSGGIMRPSQVPWKNFPNACGRVDKDASKPFGHGISLDQLAFPIFPDVV